MHVVTSELSAEYSCRSACLHHPITIVKRMIYNYYEILNKSFIVTNSSEKIKNTRLLYAQSTKKHFYNIFLTKSETAASESLEITEYMFPQYYKHGDVCNGFKSYTTPLCVTSHGNVTIYRSICNSVQWNMYSSSVIVLLFPISMLLLLLLLLLQT